MPEKATFINVPKVQFSMKAIIVNFRGSRRKQEASNQAIVHVEGVSKKESAEKLIGKKIVWANTKGNAISGRITAVHGRNGAVRTLFEKGLPGQCLGKEAKVE